MSADSLKALKAYSWPGNIRELRNIIERAIIRSEGNTLHVDIPEVSGKIIGNTLTMMEMERNHMRRVLASANWKIRGADGAAARLGLKPTTLEARMKRYGLKRPR